MTATVTTEWTFTGKFWIDGKYVGVGRVEAHHGREPHFQWSFWRGTKLETGKEPMPGGLYENRWSLRGLKWTGADRSGEFKTVWDAVMDMQAVLTEVFGRPLDPCPKEQWHPLLSRSL